MTTYNIYKTILKPAVRLYKIEASKQCPIIHIEPEIVSPQYLNEETYSYYDKDKARVAAVSSTMLLKDNAGYTINGNKGMLLSKVGFSSVLAELINDTHTVIDLFAGTGLISNMLVRRFNYQGKIIVNEYDKARYKCLKDIQETPEYIIQRASEVVGYLNKIYKPRKVTDDTLDDKSKNAKKLVISILHNMIKDGNSAAYLISQKLMPMGVAVNYDDILAAIENDKFNGFNFSNEVNALDLNIDNFAHRIKESHALSKNHELINEDAFALMQKLANKNTLEGVALYLDSDYVNYEDEDYRAKSNMGYNEATAWMKNPAQYCEKVVDGLLVPIIKKGAKILLTNEYNIILIRHLEKRGFHVAVATRDKGRKEIVASSFKIPQEARGQVAQKRNRLEVIAKVPEPQDMIEDCISAIVNIGKDFLGNFTNKIKKISSMVIEVTNRFKIQDSTQRVLKLIKAALSIKQIKTIPLHRYAMMLYAGFAYTAIVRPIDIQKARRADYLGVGLDSC